jgi:hypothetical protein
MDILSNLPGIVANTLGMDKGFISLIIRVSYLL